MATTTINTALLSDSYKFSHWLQYPPGTEYVGSYFESRGGEFTEPVMFGLQYILQTYMVGPGPSGDFCVSPSDVADARELCALHFGRGDLFNEEGWKHLLHDHYGRLPLRIRAVPEGTVVPTHNVLMTVENTCPRCYWVTNFFETLLVQAWYPITVATQSREIKRTIREFLRRTGDPALVDFKLHDFGFRGVSSVESAGIGDAAHLVNFLGTDTLRGIDLIRRHYSEKCAGFSIPASEHSTITSWGKEGEVEAFRNMLEQYPTGFVACVSDSFDIGKACSELWGRTLKDKVLQRDGVLVVRPDSGQPIARVVLDVLRRLGTAFGTTWNDKGYKLLHPKVRVIQGDGVNQHSIHDVLQTLAGEGWSADNVAFGMGGALLQKLDRDTLKMAFKCSWVAGKDAKGNSWERDVWKDPGTFHTQKSTALTARGEDHLETVFENGRILKTYTLKEIRERAAL